MTVKSFALTSEEAFEELRKPPLIGVPTLLLFIFSMSGIGAVWYYCLAGELPLWAGAILNGLLTYLLLCVIHDASHSSMSRIKWVNETLGGIGLFFFFPYAPMVILRWVHNKHHSHTNGELDPDLFEHRSPWWQIPFRWSFFDLAYVAYFLKHGRRVMKKHAVSLIAYYSMVVVLAAGAIYAGYGWELFLLWFIPSRITLFLIAIVFVVLPHYPAMVAQDEDEYMATTMRFGWEWLLTPLLVYQNYHLIHHLYPEIPFYKMHNAYYLKFDEINQRNISRQTAFGLKPANLASHHEMRRKFDEQKTLDVAAAVPAE